jgi:hypothetical protein
LRFFSPPENPSLTARRVKGVVDLQHLAPFLEELEEIHRVEFFLAAMLATAFTAA